MCGYIYTYKSIYVQKPIYILSAPASSNVIGQNRRRLLSLLERPQRSGKPEISHLQIEEEDCWRTGFLPRYPRAGPVVWAVPSTVS